MVPGECGASRAANAVGMVSVSGFLPDEGGTLQEIAGRSRDSALCPALREARAAGVTARPRDRPGEQRSVRGAVGR
jgi:hypothetical protein